MTDKQIIFNGEHDMNYCEDNNCKHYGNKEQCEKTHCYYRCYSKLYTALKRKEEECDKYKQALDEIEKLMPKFDTSDGCSYGDYDCENCSDLDEDIVCTYKLKKIIKGIINEAKE